MAEPQRDQPGHHRAHDQRHLDRPVQRIEAEQQQRTADQDRQGEQRHHGVDQRGLAHLPGGGAGDVDIGVGDGAQAAS